jgi:hypothetical protein
MDSQASPPLRAFLPTTLILLVLGWGGLAAVIWMTTPSGGTRWLMFFTGVLAFTGTSLPLVAFLNRRFPSKPPPTTSVVVRQAVWVGVYFGTLAWLQIGQVLTLPLALLLLVGLVLIEWLLRMREQAQWNPKS